MSAATFVAVASDDQKLVTDLGPSSQEGEPPRDQRVVTAHDQKVVTRLLIAEARLDVGVKIAEIDQMLVTPQSVPRRVGRAPHQARLALHAALLQRTCSLLDRAVQSISTQTPPTTVASCRRVRPETARHL